jgi:parallel beta-helix repeat protein
MSTSLLRAVLSLLVLLTAARAHARRIDVLPGPGTPLQDAILVASPGDLLVVHAGTYAEAVVIDKPLRLRGTPVNSSVVIDPGCTASTALEIASDRVSLDEFRVQGGTFFAIDIVNRDRVKLTDIQTQDTCGSAEYGVNIFASTRIKVYRNDPVGFGDAGIYVGGIAAGAKVLVRTATINPGNTRGIIVEDSFPGSVILDRNRISGATDTGIFVHNTDGVLIRHNEVQGCVVRGIHLDANSDGNRIFANVAQSNGTDVLDEGTGNCWRRNTATTGTVPPCP